jgi:hypothetical protein
MAIGTPAAGVGPLIVEDDARQLQPGQMRKSEFLDQLHTSTCSAAEEALAGTMWSAMGCPYIDRWFSHYREQSCQHIERALRRYAPETAGASSAREYIPMITERLRRGVEQWKETGEVTGVPEEMAQGGMPGVTAAGLMSGLVGGALSAVGSAVSGLVSGAGRALSGLGRALFKGREGGARGTEDPAVIQTQLGSGHSLDGSVKAQMEEAYGVSFSGVRVHTDAKAQELSGNLNARAFTIGNEIAFGAGEYQPGTLIGDALIAHELAHVVQQGGGSAPVEQMQKGERNDDLLEEEADVSALGAVVSAWGGMQGALASVGKNAMPRLRSGLRLHRCGAASQQSVTTAGQRSEEVPDLPRDVVERMRPSIGSSDDAIRQRALDELTTWARRNASLGIDWGRIRAINSGVPTHGACAENQRDEQHLNETGSCTDASDPMNITIWIGPVAFSSLSNLYSTFRHELVHVIEHHDHQRAISRGLGIQEIYAYLWELENASNTGLARRENWGLRPDGTVDKAIGLARVVDGLLRAMIRMAGEIREKPGLIPDDEVQALQSRIACALLTVPDDVLRRFPDVSREMLGPECNRARSR